MVGTPSGSEPLGGFIASIPLLPLLVLPLRDPQSRSPASALEQAWVLTSVLILQSRPEEPDSYVDQTGLSPFCWTGELSLVSCLWDSCGTSAHLILLRASFLSALCPAGR